METHNRKIYFKLTGRKHNANKTQNKHNQRIGQLVSKVQCFTFGVKYTAQTTYCKAPELY